MSADILAAAREVIAALAIEVIEAGRDCASCNDDGAAPFRDRVTIHYRLAADPSQSSREIAGFIERLGRCGWHPNPQFHSAVANTEKDGITVMVESQGVGDRVRVITVLGPCSISGIAAGRGKAQRCTDMLR